MMRSLTLSAVAAIVLCSAVFSGTELAAQVKPDIIKKIEAALPKAAPAKAKKARKPKTLPRAAPLLVLQALQLLAHRPPPRPRHVVHPLLECRLPLRTIACSLRLQFLDALLTL